MYNVIITNSADIKIARYAKYYRDLFVTRFTDTGMGYAETLIIQQYIESADFLAFISKQAYACIFGLYLVILLLVTNDLSVRKDYEQILRISGGQK